MAELNDRERTESPSQKRLDDAREKGQVPRSRDLTAAAVVLAGGLGLYSMGSILGSRMLALMHDGLSVTRTDALDSGRMVLQFEHGAAQGLLAAAPVLGVLLAAALVAPLAIGGWNFSVRALGPDFSRLRPIAGFGRGFLLR